MVEIEWILDFLIIKNFIKMYVVEVFDNMW